jgi:hypothetical protein
MLRAYIVFKTALHSFSAPQKSPVVVRITVVHMGEKHGNEESNSNCHIFIGLHVACIRGEMVARAM